MCIESKPMEQKQPLLPGGGAGANFGRPSGTFGQKQNKKPILLSWRNVNCAIDDVSGPPCRRQVNRKQILSVSEGGGGKGGGRGRDRTFSL